jgi:hypothetical protein
MEPECSLPCLEPAQSTPRYLSKCHLNKSFVLRLIMAACVPFMAQCCVFWTDNEDCTECWVQSARKSFGNLPPHSPGGTRDTSPLLSSLPLSLSSSLSLSLSSGVFLCFPDWVSHCTGTAAEIDMALNETRRNSLPATYREREREREREILTWVHPSYWTSRSFKSA